MDIVSHLPITITRVDLQNPNNPTLMQSQTDSLQIAQINKQVSGGGTQAYRDNINENYVKKELYVDIVSRLHRQKAIDLSLRKEIIMLRKYIRSRDGMWEPHIQQATEVPSTPVFDQDPSPLK